MTPERGTDASIDLGGPTSDEIQKALNDWANINRIRFKLEGAGFFPEIREHLRAGKSIALFVNHQAHPDFLIATRIVGEISECSHSSVSFPASSKLYPGGDLYEKDGRRMFAFGAALGINYHRMIQDYNVDESLAAGKVNLRAFSGLRADLSNERAAIGYFIEGGRGDGSGIMRPALAGAEFIFARRIGNEEELLANKHVLGIPVVLQDTGKLTGNKAVAVANLMLRNFPVNVGRPFYASDIVQDGEVFGVGFSDAIGVRMASLLPARKRGFYSSAKYAKAIKVAENR